MNNIFENAYFGKAYKTRDDRKDIEQKVSEIVKTITKHFGDSIEELEVSLVGTRVNVTLSYTDFITLPQARRWLDDHIDRLWCVEVYRGFSDTKISSIKDDTSCEEEELYELAEELFFSKDFSDLCRV